MESCESPAVSGTDDGLAATISQQQQHLSPQPWNEHPRAPTPPSSQPLPLEPLSLSAPYPSQLQASSAPLQEGVREQQKHPTHTAPGESAKAERQTRTEEEEEEEGSCGEEDDDDLDDLDDDEGMDCYPSLQPFPGMSVAPGGGMPALLGRRTRQPVEAESGSEEGEEEEEEECSDVENLAGEIVYQPDGSAYIVESISQLIQSGGGVAPSGLLPTNSLLPSLGKQGEPAGTSSAVYPQIINTFHIASSFGKWFGSSDQGFPNTSSLAGLSPVLHSFRVFDVRHKSNKDYLNSDGSAKNSCVSKDVPNNVDFSKFDGLALYGQGKPILMCFLCKLSFGYVRSFATHAVHDHRMTLSEDERRLLGHKLTSAIIQGIGKDKEPLISFLEPKNKSPPPPPTLLPMGPGQSFYGTFSGVQLEGGNSSSSGGGGGSEALKKDLDSGPQQTLLGSLVTVGGLGSPKLPLLTSAQGPAKDSSVPPERGGRAEGPAGGRGGTQRGENEEGNREREARGEGKVLFPRDDVSDEEEDLIEDDEEEEDDMGNAVACSSSSGREGGELAVSNQSISKSPLLMPSSALQPSACPFEASTAHRDSKSTSSISSSSFLTELEGGADGGEKNSELLVSFNCQGMTLPAAAAEVAVAAGRGEEEEEMASNTSSAAVASTSPTTITNATESANRDSATAPEPNESLAEGEEDSGALMHHHHLLHHHHHHHLLHPSQHPHSHPHPGAPCELAGAGECPQDGGASGSGVECPKCDTVLGSSRSLGGHMTMMHSRNSCKTLKCPKCNWHYKYQQTLEAHMKEKHPDLGGSCVYCTSGQSHPRLARGESYTCGYKPFRCEVCNYSTTTKGNLSIHMQSDKHLNNMQNLQNGGSIAAVTTAGDQVFGHTPGGVVGVPSAAQAPVHHHPAHHHHHPVQATAHAAGACGAPSPTKPKSKPMWRCEVCDYETNVARNLRIHMTSEKHMHNMMLLQQNMSQMQHGRLGLGALPSPSEAELYQYYLTQNMNLPPSLKMDSSGADTQYLLGGFQLDPNMAALAPALGETLVF
ncbi:Zinc finger homeobox protein 3 [Acipenser ruthenus]|uniref:Zinc finger homeobox protein 3 n=1 Tax=Acipenser ruthenus TaxID=7906 RepID=A0A444TWE9_ACIRT|nr:Zinc finger homeobox protein 3 [Acipenser ruthenus]